MVLTRRISESIIIGDDVKITILGIKASQIRIGIEAPKEVYVMREELYNRGVRKVTPEGNHIDDDNPGGNK